MSNKANEISKAVSNLDLTDCRIELSLAIGWKRIPASEVTLGSIGYWPDGYWEKGNERLAAMFCPVHASIDSIQALVPEGFVVKILHGSQIGSKTVLCTAWLPTLDCKTVAYEQNNLYSEGETEILARARITLACIRLSKIINNELVGDNNVSAQTN